MLRTGKYKSRVQVSKNIKQLKRVKKRQTCIEQLENRVLLTATTWTGGSGNWNLSSNWSDGIVPGSGDSVTIPSGSSVQVTDSESAATVTSASDSTITVATGGTLGIYGGTISGTFIDNGLITGPGSATGQPVFAGSTSFQSSGGTTGGYFLNTGSLALNGNVLDEGTHLSSSGTITASGTIGVALQSVVTNLAGGTLDITDGASIGVGGFAGGGAAPVLVNYGLIDKIGSSTGGLAPDANNAALSLEDVNGTIESTGGTLELVSQGQFDGTTFIAAAGTSIVVDDAVAPDTVSYNLYGTLTGSGAGTLQLQGSGADVGTPSILNSSPTAPAVLNFPAGFAQVSGMFFESDSFTTVNQGTLTYTGSTTDGSAGLDNKGTIDVTGTGDFDVNRNGAFTNDTTGVLNFETDAGVTNDNGGTSFTNDGLIEKTGGAGTTTIGGGTANVGFFNNGGTFDVESGTLSIANGGGGFGFTIPDNGIVAAPGTDFDLGGQGNTDTINVQGNLNVSGGGTFSISGDYLAGPSGGYNQSTATPATLNFNTNILTVDGGGFNDNVNLINDGQINFSSGDMGQLLNEGTVTLGSGVIVDSGTFINATGGVILSGTSDGIFRQGNNGNVQNAGVFVMSPGAGNTFDMTGTEIYNTGTLIFGPGTTKLPWLSNGYDTAPGLFPDGQSIPSGSLFQLNAGATVDVDTTPSLTAIAGTVIMNAGTSFPALDSVTNITGSWSVLSGETVSLTGGLTNSGTLSVGGSLTVNGAFTQTANPDASSPPTPVLDFEVAAAAGASGAPLLAVTGATTLAGNLTADYVNGYTGGAGAYTVATFASAATGRFASTAGTAPFFTPSVSASQIVLNGIAFSGTGGSSPGGIAIPTGGTGGGGSGGNGSGGTTTGDVDLAISTVTAPASFTPGSSQTITWSVINSGTGATAADWQDSVFLSTGTTLSADDTLLGRVPQTTAVASGGSYTGTLTVHMPAVGAGAYYVIVVVDSRETLSETSYTNNTAVSAATTATLPALTLGTTTTGSLAASQEQLYTLSVTSGETIQLAGTFAAALEANLYVSFNAIPTPQSSDESATDPNQTAPSLLLLPAQAGTYYVLLYARPDITSVESFSLTPTAITYGPVSIAPSSGINAGNTTITVNGVGFTPTTMVSLVSPVAGAADVPATSVQYVSANQLYATFNLSGAATQGYGIMTSEGSGGQSATLAQAFTVNVMSSSSGGAAAAPGNLVFSLSVPYAVRVGDVGVATLYYENDGGSDIAAPLFSISADTATMRLTGSGESFIGGLDVLGISPAGPAGILAPGASNAISIDFIQTTDNAHVTTNFLTADIDPSTLINLTSLVADLHPAGTPEDTWLRTFANLETMVGAVNGNASSGQYAAVLDEDATYLGSIGERTADVGKLNYYLIEQAGNFGAIGSQYALSDFGRGQTDPYNITAVPDTAGNVTIGEGGTERIFTINSDGSYNAPPGDGGSLSLSGGIYTLTNSDGSQVVFNSSDTVNYYVDAHGNKTVATISAERVSLPLVVATQIDGVETGTVQTVNETLDLVTSLVAADGQTTTLTYNSEGLCTGVANSDGVDYSFAYDPNTENLLSENSAQGTTTYTYDTGGLHLLQSIAYPGGITDSYQYDDMGRLTQSTETGGADPITYSYDEVGNVTTTDAAGDTDTTRRNINGEVVAVINGLGQLQTYSYDPAGAVTTVTNYNGSQSTIAYQAGAGDIPGGDDVSTTNADGATQSATYGTLSGLPLTETDADNNTSTFTYDSAGDVLTDTDAANAVDTFTYTTAGEIATAITAAGRGVTDSYNALDELIGQTFSDGTSASYTYDSFGDLTSATNGAGTENFAYNSAFDLTKITYPTGLSLTYTYNAAGQLTSKQDQTGFVTNYTYDATGQLASLTGAAGNVLASYTYNAAGEVTSVAQGNGDSTTYAYNANAQVTMLTNYGPGGAVISQFSYAYNSADLIASVFSLTGTTTYSYDAAGQLIEAVMPGGETLTYTYDAEGNRTSVTDTGGGAGAGTYSVNNLNQYTTAAGTTYNYDADGNLTSSVNSGVTTTYTYNVHGWLTEISSPGSITVYTYDALGNRIASTVNGVTTDNLLDPSTGDELVGQFTTSGSLIDDYTYGLGLTSQVNAAGTANYYSFDGSGNTIALTGSNGAVVSSYSYLPFGQLASGNNTAANPFTFDGQEGVTAVPGGSTLYLTQHRLYDAGTGRFTQRDPTGASGSGSDLYQYANNDPVNESDPTGELAAGAGLAFLDKFGFLPLGPAQEAIAESLVPSASLVEEFEGANEVGSMFVNLTESFVPGENLPALYTGVGNSGELIYEGDAIGVSVDSFGAGSSFYAGTQEEAVSAVAERLIAERAAAGAASESIATTLGTGAAGFIAAPLVIVPALYSTYKFNASHPDGIPVPVQNVINTATFQRVLRDPILTELINDYTATTGHPPDQQTLNDLIQISSHKYVYDPTTGKFSDDPNDIVGPAGYGAAGFIPGVGLLPYQIYFTNDATATAPAAVVTLTEQLSTNLDWSTFQLGAINFGSTTIDVPAGLQQYTTTMALGSTLTLDISASFDAGTGVATWTYTTIDNATGDVPSDPSLGFLPADVTPPQGEGFVDYTVSPNTGLATGTVISASASVVFDNNAAITTSTITNTIDAVAPTSTIAVLPATETTPYFTVSWSGSDDAGGSGIVSYVIFVSEDGGAFSPWFRSNASGSAVYTASPGHSYSFYSLAIDGAGNAQDISTAQATTAVPAIVRTITVTAGHPARFTDAAGKSVVISLSGPGSGTLSFISAGNADPVSFALTNTTAKSRVTVSAAGKPGTLTLSDVSVIGSLASFIAPTSDLAGSFSVTGTLGSLSLDNINTGSSTITIAGGGTTTFSLGIVQDLNLTTPGIIRSLVAKSWTNGPFAADSITAQQLQRLTVHGPFDADLQITSGTLAASLGSITAGTWTLGGSVASLSTGTISNGWIGTLTGAIGSMVVRGNFDGSLTALSIRTLNVTGSMTNSTIDLTGTAATLKNRDALTSLSVSGSMTTSTIDALANIGTITVGGMTGSTIFDGVASGTTTLPSASSDFTTTASIDRFTNRGKTPFADSLIAAASLGTIDLLDVTTSNGGTTFGIAADAITSLEVTVPKTKAFHYTKKDKAEVLTTLPGDLRANLL